MSDDSSYVLNFKWAFGLNHKITSGIQYLTSANRNQVLYASAHTGVIYDYENNKQFLLRGHCNTITSLCKSQDDHWVATADSGPDSLIIVWDTQPSLTLKQEQEYQQQMLRNEKLDSSQDNENMVNNEVVSRESSTDTIDFESLRNKNKNNSNYNSKLSTANDNNSDEEEEEEKEDTDIEKEIKNIIDANIDKNKEEGEEKEGKDNNNLVLNKENKAPEGTPSTETSDESNTTSSESKVVTANSEEIDKTTPVQKENKNANGDMVEPIDNMQEENAKTEENEQNKTEDIVEPIDEINNIFESGKSINKTSSKKKKRGDDDYYNTFDCDELEFLPIKTIINPHHNCGVVAMKMSRDSKYLVTLGADSPQTICIWNWTTENKDPICEFTLSGERQKYVDFNASNSFELVTNGISSIYFYTWDFEEGIKQHTPIMNSKELIPSKIKYTYTIFIPNTQKALSATECGSIILWDNCELMNLSKKLDDGNKSAIKIMKLHNGPINVIDIINDKYFITGGEDGFIRIYDFQYRLYIWLEKINGGPVLSISFNKNRPGPSIVNSLNIPDFMILTKHAKILHIFNGEDDNTKKKMINTNDPALNINDSNMAISKYLEKNGKKTQIGSNAMNNIENLNDPNKNSPNYDIDKFITISKFPQFKIILEAQYEKVSSIQSHPLKPEIAIAGHSGLLQIYNYLTKELIIQRQFEIEEEKNDEKEKENEKNLSNLIKKKVFIKKINKIESIAYSNKGAWIAVGFTNGSIKIVDSIKLTDILMTPDQSLQICSVQKPITQFSWSLDDSILAAADEDNGVSIIKREEISFSKKNIDLDFKPAEIHGQCLSIFKDIMESNNNTKNYYMGDDTLQYEWNFIGRYQAHWKKIIKIIFIPSTPPRLLSLSQDRMIVEYDLENSSFIDGIKIKVKKQLEQTATPSALCLNNTRNEYNNNEDFFITANEDYKLKLFNSNTFLCRKTVMSPNYGSPINMMCILPIQNTHNKYLVYSTQNSIIGVLKLPLSGNPYDNLGVMAHSGEIVGLCCSKDGHYVFSSDSYDTAINMWSVNVEVLEAQNAIGGKGNEPFINLLDPRGRDSDIYKEMEDYFYYAQLRTQGEDCIRNRVIEKKIGISEVACILQAIGYYPSEQDIEDIKNEIKYSKVLETGDYIEYIEFEDLIRIYLNHRPAIDLTKKQIEDALTRTKQYEMPNVESDNEGDNDVYYMGETDTQEYLENFNFKASEEDETNIIKKLLKNNSSSQNSSKVNSTSSLNNENNENENNNKNDSSTNDTQTDTKSSDKGSNGKLSDDGDDKESSLDPPESKKKSENGTSSTTSGKSSRKGNDKRNKIMKEIMDNEDQTEARYITMKLNESERKKKMEKARQKREMIKSRENGKFSKSALLSMLQQNGESLSAELFNQYIDELLKDSQTKYKQLAEFFTLDEFVNDVLSFEEEPIPETLIEKLNNHSSIDNNNMTTKPSTMDSSLPQSSLDNWMNNTESDTESNYYYT